MNTRKLSFGDSLPELSYRPGADSLSVTFKTHLNYIKCMSRLTNSIVFNIPSLPTAGLDPRRLTKFENLARITAQSIQGEKDACDKERGYAQVASPWIPVKCYYQLYYLESTFMYLLDGSTVGFNNGGHTRVKRAIVKHLQNGTISLSGEFATELATVVNWAAANSYKTTSGANITESYHSTPDCVGSLRKKISEYIENDWKQSEKIFTYRTRAARTKKATVLCVREFCLMDYFYWMRIKANYRDVDFLDFDNHVNEEDAYEYSTHYVRATFNYASAISAATEMLKTSRHM
jgi:hypothetical protein